MLLIAALFAATFMVGCSTDSDNGGGVDIDAPVKFKGTFEKRTEYSTAQNNAQSMVPYAYLGDGEYCYWEKGDEVSVFTQNNKNLKFRSAKGDVVMTDLYYTEDGVNPSQLVEIEDYYAIFPFKTANTVDANGKLYCSLPAEQVYNPEQVDMNNAIMVSRIPSTSDVFEFKNSCALIKLYIKKYSSAVKDVKVQSIEVLSKANNLAGDVYVETASGDYTAKVATTGTPSKSVKLVNCEAAGSLDFEDYTIFFITIPAATYAANDLTISIKTTVGALDKVATLPKKYALTRSKYVELKTMLGGNTVEINDDVESVDKAIMCDVEKVSAQGFEGAETIKYDYEVPVGDLTINGNGKTYNFKMTSEEVFIFNTFTTRTSGHDYAGGDTAKVTVNDLNITGELRTTCMGVYEDNKIYNAKIQGQFNTEWNNVNVLNNKIVPYSDSNIMRIGAAVCVYGKGVLNNCNIYGTRLTDSEYAKDHPEWQDIPMYDMGCPNSSRAHLNGCRVGSIYGWEQSKIYAYGGTTIDYIYTTAISTGNLGLLEIKDATVDEIYCNPAGTYEPAMNVYAGAKIGTLTFGDELKNDTDALFNASYWLKVKIAEGATIEKVIVGEEEMTLAAFREKYSIKTL